MPITDCKYASIYTLQDDYLCEARVTRIEDEYVTLMLENSNIELLSTQVHVVFFDAAKGLVTCLCELSDFKQAMHFSNLNRCTAHCTILQPISETQRRNDIKVSLNIPISLSMGSLRNVPGVIRNISAGGIFFTCRQTFQKGDVISFTFYMSADKPPLHLQAEILRVQDNLSLYRIIGQEADDEELVGFGCRFVRLRAPDEAQIRNYVFRQDLIRRRRFLTLE